MEELVLSDKLYNIGLDIGTSSVGFAVTDTQDKLIRVKGKTAIGVRLFEEGQTAAERRGFRTTRRRLSRRKWRINLLNQIFDPYISKIDPTFFARLKNSNLAGNDKKFDGSLLFPDRMDYKFYEEFPTIYHLRKQLMEEDRKFDLREIYLAMHHIIKYRGNFLNTTPMNHFKNEKINFEERFLRLNELYEIIDVDNLFQFDLDNIKMIEIILADKEIFKLEKQKKIAKLLSVVSSEKLLKKENTTLASNFAKAILGYKFNLASVLKIRDQDKNDWNLSLSDEDFDEKLAGVPVELDENQLEVIEILHSIFNAIALSEIVKSGENLSDAMVEKYNEHKLDLKLLKTVITSLDDRKKAKELQRLYKEYVGKEAKKTLSREDFYKGIQKNLDDSSNAKKIIDSIKRDQFMPKQRTSQNGVIPRQLHQQELDQIIENQGKYYPFLKEINPNTSRIKQAKYKLDELIAFKIPYYVGPLITPEDQKRDSGKHFAWMKRKEGGQITPWNFEKKVDRIESANRFIKRMTTKDTYLLAEDVVPAESLVYEKFKVLNELNNVRINGKRLTVQDKQDVFNKLFKIGKSVSSKQLQKYFIQEKRLKTVEISGLSDPQKFLSSLGTYNDFKKIFGSIIDDPKMQDDFEKIIEWSTIFEDRGIFKAKLNQITWLTDVQKKKISAKRYKGWGKLSKRLLVDLRNEQGNSILDEMWNTDQNFMQVQSQNEFAQLIHAENERQFAGNDAENVWDQIESILDDAYTSPQNKKAIRQVVKVVRDIEKAMGHAPEKIAIEFTRAPDKNPKRSVSRVNQLRKKFEEASGEVVTSTLREELNNYVKSKKKLGDKLYLYFTQLGRDIYTNAPINIDQLDNYDMDHILPQAFLKDDSLDNRVLTARAINNGKSNEVPVRIFGPTRGAFWKELLDNGFISKKKYKNLITDPETINKYTKQGFIRRQLVETSQIIKLTANILGGIYKEQTEIIEVTAKLNHQMRDMFDLVKVREVNDYHHAFDAYLTIFLGNYLYKRYPKLRPYFVYGDFKKVDKIENNIKSFNFINQLGQNKSVVDEETGEILWSNTNPTTIDYIKRIYRYKFMLVSREVSTRHAAMFDQTIYPASKKDKLIPIKLNKPTALYGGHSGNVDVYMTIVAYEDKSGKNYKVIGIPLREANQLERLESRDRKQYLEKLKDILEPSFIKVKVNRKTGEKVKTKIEFKIVVEKVYYRQLIQDGKIKMTLGSASYKYNARQLVLSEKALKVIANNKKYESKDENQDLIDVYDEILGVVNKSFELYDINKFRKKLNENRSKFVELPITNIYEGVKVVQTGKREVLTEILNGLHANATTGDLTSLGISTPFGKMQVSSGIVLSPQTVLIYQSPTGLFERKIKLSDL